MLSEDRRTHWSYSRDFDEYTVWNSDGQIHILGEVVRHMVESMAKDYYKKTEPVKRLGGWTIIKNERKPKKKRGDK